MPEETIISLKITDAQVQQAISAQLAKMITPDVQRDAIAQALRYLITPKSSGYGTDKSPLARAYEAAINDKIREWATEFVAQDESFRDAVKAALTKASVAIVSKSYEFEATVIAAAVKAASDIKWSE